MVSISRLILDWYLKYGYFTLTQNLYRVCFKITSFSYIIECHFCSESYPFCYFHYSPLLLCDEAIIK